MKKELEDLTDTMISKVSFYGENLDFFFMAASITTSESKRTQKHDRRRDLVRLKPDKL